VNTCELEGPLQRIRAGLAGIHRNDAALAARGIVNRGSGYPRKRPAALSVVTRELRRYAGHRRASQPIDRAADTQRPSIQNVQVDHRRRHVGMPEEFLYGANVIAVLEQVRGK
jgi:hypothetical protein